MTPIIYNLFQRLVGPVGRWPEHAERASELGFNWLYLNPWHYPGFSGSLYAPREFARLNPLFVQPGGDDRDLTPLRATLQAIRDHGLLPMMDLVINHTSKDALLTQRHPSWYVRGQDGDLVSPSVTDPDDPSLVTVWGDLAEIDNEHSSDREALWDFWRQLVLDSLRLGFAGFRCDAAYKVPPALWRYLIDAAREVDPAVTFFAETLGAPLESVIPLREAGFDFIFNSSKWWDFTAPWAMEQHQLFRDAAPSIAFPESHDTSRLADDTGGNEAIQRQRYAFAAAFSAGVMMPIGYEYGFRRQLHVVDTMPADWEVPSFDLRPFISRVNRRKLASATLQGEGRLTTPWGLDGDVLLLERTVAGREGFPHNASNTAWILMNKRADASFEVSIADVIPPTHRLHRICRDDSPPVGEAYHPGLELGPAEVVYALPD